MISGEVESIAFGGSGILKDKGLVVFVPFTAPRDKVSIAITQHKKHFAFGSLLTLETPGPDRIEPSCPHFQTCGGCQFQHLTYVSQLEIKRRFIEDALTRIARIAYEIPPVIPAPHPWNYRHHITLKLQALTAGGFQAGYTGCDNQSLIPIAHCPIFCLPGDTILLDLQEIASHLCNRGIREASVRLFKASEKEPSSSHYQLAFTFSPHAPDNISSLIALLEKYPHIDSIFVGSPDKPLTFGKEECTTESLGISASFSPYGFLQNFPQQRDAIYRAILADAPNCAQKILDLYCGIGITSLLFAQKGKSVIGIEAQAQSIAKAQENAQKNELTVQFICDTVESKAPSLLASFQPDLMLCNPPREGVPSSLLNALIDQRTPYIQYLSCMPSTLARDLKILCAGGYEIEKIQGFDMFPQTTHVETLVLLKHV
ncbi:MAG TPA: 23S rRNA (uracil(1939)-C(5))-methyltransferase RlmD [Rhabdochlamydiaceae bacterium]|jgi:23S rRNA (uracil1939-C5)-methyltransferase